MWKTKRLDTVCSACASGVSVVCMTSMGAAIAAAGASAGAGAASMAGIHSQHAGGTSSVFLTAAGFFDRIGFDFLNNIPDSVAQPLLSFALAIALATAYIAYRGHRRPQSFLLTLASSVALYVGIYVWMSDALFFLGLGGLLAAGVLGMFLSSRAFAPFTQRTASGHG